MGDTNIGQPWDELLTDADRAVIANGGYGKQRGLGSSPVLMVIDCQRIYIGDDAPVEQQQSRWPAGGGAAAWRAVENIAALVKAAEQAGTPVIYTRNVQKQSLLFDGFAKKTTWDHKRAMEDSPDVQIVDALTPSDRSLVLDKSYASAFYGTPLVSWLVGLGVDSLIVTGVSTSGCVRATSVDAVSRGFNVAVVSDATADRISVSHQVALLDLWMKYTDLASTSAVKEMLEGR